MNHYMTKPGDTIYKITEENNFSFKRFVNLNDINHLKWVKGQVLLIPEANGQSIKLIEHVIKENEKLEDIMVRYTIDYEKIKYFNNLMYLLLEEGQSIEIEHKILSPVSDEFYQE